MSVGMCCVYLSVCPSASVFFIVSVCPSVYLSVCLSISLSVCLSVCLFCPIVQSRGNVQNISFVKFNLLVRLFLSVCLFLSVSVCVCLCLSVCLSACLYHLQCKIFLSYYLGKNDGIAFG